jgi:outer membrane protein TolC
MLRQTATIATVGFAVLLAPGARAADAGSQPAPAAVGSLRLEEAVRLALTRNERAKISDLNVVVAEAAVEKARAAFLPLLTAQGNDVQHAYAATDKNPNNIGQATVTLSQSILNAPAFPLYSQAKRLADAQRAQNVDDKRLLAFTTASAFFAVLNAQDVVKAAQRQVDNAQANLDNTQARAQAALTSSNDVTRAHIDRASAARELEIDKGTLEGAILQLAFTINAPVPAAIEPPQATLAAAQQALGTVDALVRLAMDRRPDVLVSKNQSAAAHDFAGEPMLRLLPTLGVQAQALATTNSATTGRWNDETLQATLSWTLYDQGVRYADKHARDAQAEIADLNLQQLVRNVDTQVRSTAALLVASQAAFVVAQSAVTAARQSVDETSILYRQGLAKAIELVDANDSRFASEINYATAEYAMAQAYLNLRQALGLDAIGTELR